MKYVVFYMCRRIKILISNWPRKLKSSQCLQAGKTGQLLLTFLTKGTRWSRSTSNFYALIGQDLTGEFMRKIYAACILKLVYVSTCDVFNCLFPLSVQNIRRLSKSEIRFRNGIVFVFSPCLMRKRVEKSEAILALFHSFQCLESRMVSLINFCIWCSFFISNLMKSSVVYAAN